MAQIDVSTITDVTQLKAMAYDQLILREQAEANFNNLNERLVQLTVVPSATGTATQIAVQDGDTPLPPQ